MNARVLRKWSLTKFLTYLWLPVVMLLVIWSQSATSMHLSTNIRAMTAFTPEHLPLDSTISGADHQQFTATYPRLNRIRPAYTYAPVISNYNSDKQEAFEVYIRTDAASNAANAAIVPHVPKLNSQVINLNSLSSSANIETPRGSSSSNSRFTKLRGHTQLHRLQVARSQQNQMGHNGHPSHEYSQQDLSPMVSSQVGSGGDGVGTGADERFQRLPSEPINGSWGRRRIIDRLPMVMIGNDKKDDNINDNTAARNPDSMNFERQKLITANERLLQQREKQARTDAHRRRLMRVKQLSRNNYSRTMKATSTTIPRQRPIDNDLNKLMIGRNRRDSRLYAQSAYRQQRKRSRRYCSARDPTQLAFEAPTVFEGKITSMSYDRRANFSVTFEVKEIFKSQKGYVLPHLLRLQFTYRNTSGECDIYREHMRPRGFVRDELEQGRVYIMFVQQINSGNFTILGQPIKKTRRAVEAVKKGVSKDYAQPASIKSLTANKLIVHNGEELRIVCRIRGQPPPKVTWFKDDKSIRNRRLYQFIHLKKRSELVVKSFNSSDAGLYECRAKNKAKSRKLEKRTIRIQAFSRPADESYSHSTGDECTGNFEQYCLNGGTCQYFREISVPSCECPDGYVGDRCQEKEWNNVTPNPTFKTGFMADEPLESEEDDIEEDSEEISPTKDTAYSNKLN